MSDSRPSMLRAESLVAVDDVALAHRRAARGYEHAAGMLDDDELAEMFAALARQHRDMADALAPHIRRLGGHPSEPDPDRALVQSAVRHVKSALATDAQMTLLRERERDEHDLAEHLDQALARGLPAETAELLAQQRDVVAATRRRLALARVTPR